MPRISLATRISFSKFKSLFGHMFHYSHEETREKKMKQNYDAAIKELESRPRIVKNENKVIEETPGQDQQAGS